MIGRRRKKPPMTQMAQIELMREESCGGTPQGTRETRVLPEIHARMQRQKMMSVQEIDFSRVTTIFHGFSAFFTPYFSHKLLIYSELRKTDAHKRHNNSKLEIQNSKLQTKKADFRAQRELCPSVVCAKEVQKGPGIWREVRGKKGWMEDTKGALMRLDRWRGACYGLGHDIECSASCTGGRRRYRRRRWGLSKLNQISTKNPRPASGRGFFYEHPRRPGHNQDTIK
jgi:hypothetical protein